MEPKKSNIAGRISLIISILSLIMSIVVLFLGEGIYLEYKHEKELNKQKQEELEESYLLLAEDYYLKEDYEKVAKVYASDILQNNPWALLNKGVMYANGMYYQMDKDKAKQYFYKALKAGEEYYSIIYLLSILDSSEGKDGIDEVNRIFIKGCKKNNQFCERVLQFVYQINHIEIDTKKSYIDDFNSKNKNEKEKILAFLYPKLGEYSKWYVENYTYTVDEDGNVSAEADEIREEKYDVIGKKFLNHEYEMIFEYNFLYQ